MKAICPYILVALLVVLPVMCAEASVYRNVDGCMIAVPDSWLGIKDALKIKGCTLFTADPNSFPINGIMIDPVRIGKYQETQGEEENEVLDGMMYSLSKSPRYSVLDRSDTCLGGVNGKSVTLRYGRKGTSKMVRLCASAFVVGGRAYIIMCGCDDATFTKNIPAYANSLASVRFTDK